MVEIPIFDLTSLKNLELQDLYGYRSETFFWMNRQQTTLLNKEAINYWKPFITLLQKYEFFFIHCCIKGYIDSCFDTLKKLKQQQFLKVNKTSLKRIYRLCYIFEQSTKSDLVSKETLLSLKGASFEKLDQEDYIKLETILTKLNNQFLIDNTKAEAWILKNLKQEAELLWS
jgi:hypothetical protein